ncbi:NADP-dependent oxidoreductase [Halomonas sp. WWR20]
MTVSHYFTLDEHPRGLPERELFQFRETPLEDVAEGEVRVRNTWLSVDPYMRGRMNGVKTYVEPFKLGAPLQGGAIGEVVASRHPRFHQGDRVRHMFGWRDVAQVPGDHLEPLPVYDVPEQAYLGVLGMPGMTAWTGLNLIAQLQEGERVLVSAASGAVGSLAVQLAKSKGCQVVGVAGSQSKLDWLEARGVGAVSYRDKDAQALTQDLKEACPEGFDVYFENVGGVLLEAALNNLRDHGRIAVCGMIERYNDTTPQPGPSNLFLLTSKRARMQGFIVSEHWDHYLQFLDEVAPHVEHGDIDYQETIEEGLERTPDAFLKLFEGGNQGKMLVRLNT